VKFKTTEDKNYERDGFLSCQEREVERSETSKFDVHEDVIIDEQLVEDLVLECSTKLQEQNDRKICMQLQGEW